MTIVSPRLPAGLYYGAEWKALGEGKDLRKYIPLSVIETVVPLVFVAIYAYLFVIARSAAC